jgi:hypothetical protein
MLFSKRDVATWVDIDDVCEKKDASVFENRHSEHEDRARRPGTKTEHEDRARRQSTKTEHEDRAGCDLTWVEDFPPDFDLDMITLRNLITISCTSRGLLRVAMSVMSAVSRCNSSRHFINTSCNRAVLSLSLLSRSKHNMSKTCKQNNMKCQTGIILEGRPPFLCSGFKGMLPAWRECYLHEGYRLHTTDAIQPVEMFNECS